LPTVESVVVASVLVAPGFIATTMALSLSGGFLNRTVDGFVLLLWSLISSLLIDAVYFAAGGDPSPITNLLAEDAAVGPALTDLSELVVVLFGLALVLGGVYAVVLVYDLPDRARAVLWKSRQIKRSPESPWLNHLRDADRVLIELADGEQFYGGLRYYSTDGDPRREVRINRPQRRDGWGAPWEQLDLTGNGDGFSILLNAENIEKIVGYPKVDSFRPLRNAEAWQDRLRADPDYDALRRTLEETYVLEHADAVAHELVYKNNFRWRVALVPLVRDCPPERANGTLLAASRDESGAFAVGAVVEPVDGTAPPTVYTVSEGTVRSLTLDGRESESEHLAAFQWMRDLFADLDHVDASKFAHVHRRKLWWPTQSLRKLVAQLLRSASDAVRYVSRDVAYPFERRDGTDGTAIGTVSARLRGPLGPADPEPGSTEPVNSYWFGFGRTERLFDGHGAVGSDPDESEPDGRPRQS
jgi:hypothetical protein